MPIRVSRFEKPSQVVRDEKTATSEYARFVAEPFEIGYARTIGNSLASGILLSSIEGSCDNGGSHRRVPIMSFARLRAFWKM
jgi:DNA-directed RNA polymerase subunit alpha